MKTLAWDVDDVLNSLMQEWLEYFQKTNNNSPVAKNFEQLTENPPHRLLGITMRQYQESLDGFRLSENYQKLFPNAEILQWFNEYGLCCRHIALTAVPLVAAHVSSAWTLRHFGKWIRTFHFVPSPRSEENIPDYDLHTKADFIKWHGKIDALIDDNQEHIGQVHQMGLKGVLISRPWNAGQNSLSSVLATLAGFVAV
jgi:hypothetical protein